MGDADVTGKQLEVVSADIVVRSGRECSNSEVQSTIFEKREMTARCTKESISATKKERKKKQTLVHKYANLKQKKKRINLQKQMPFAVLGSDLIRDRLNICNALK